MVNLRLTSTLVAGQGAMRWLLASTMVVRILVCTSEAASATQGAGGSAACSLSGTITISPPLARSGGGTGTSRTSRPRCQAARRFCRSTRRGCRAHSQRTATRALSSPYQAPPGPRQHVQRIPHCFVTVNSPHPPLARDDRFGNVRRRALVPDNPHSQNLGDAGSTRKTCWWVGARATNDAYGPRVISGE